MKKVLKTTIVAGGVLSGLWTFFNIGMTLGIGAGNTVNDIAKPLTSVDEIVEEFCETLNLRRLVYRIGQFAGKEFNQKNKN